MHRNDLVLLMFNLSKVKLTDSGLEFTSSILEDAIEAEDINLKCLLPCNRGCASNDDIFILSSDILSRA